MHVKDIKQNTFNYVRNSFLARFYGFQAKNHQNSKTLESIRNSTFYKLDNIPNRNNTFKNMLINLKWSPGWYKHTVLSINKVRNALKNVRKQYLHLYVPLRHNSTDGAQLLILKYILMTCSIHNIAKQSLVRTTYKEIQPTV